MITIRKAETTEEIGEAIDLQLRVFAHEQGIPEDACIEGNDESVHLLAQEDNATVAAARLRQLGDGEAEVARVAVLRPYRGSGIGKQLLVQLEAVARESDVQYLVLHPHARLESFYESLGYAKTDDATYDIGEHAIITMRKSLAGAKT